MFALALIWSLSAFAAENVRPFNSTVRAADTFDLTINIVGDGSFSKDPDKATYEAGEEVEITAQPVDPTWEFIGWSGDIISTTNPISVTMNQSYVLTATFKQFCHELTLNHTSQGSDPSIVSPANSIGCDPGFFVAGEEIEVEAQPDPKYRVASWLGTVNNNSTEESNTVLMPNNDHTVTVNYQAICHTLTLNSDPTEGGDIEVTEGTCPFDPSKYIVGTSVGLEAKPNDGYKFDSWSGTDNDSSQDKNNTITMDGDRSVTATFDLSCHPLILSHSPQEGGSAPSRMPQKSPSCSLGEYVAGQQLSFSATPNANYRVEKWVGTNNDSNTSNNNTLTFPALPNGTAHAVAVRYIPKPTLEFTLGTYQINEDGGTATIEVRRTGSITEEVNVSYLTSNGTAKSGQDYISTSGTLTFSSMDVLESFQVEILNDNIAEGTEALNLTLFDNSANSVLGPQSAAELEILDDEGNLTVQFQTTTYEVQEISPTLSITITLNTPSDEDIFVRFQTQAGTATSGQDYVEHTEIVPFFADMSETAKQVTIEVLDDTLDEPMETVQLQIYEPNGPLLDEAIMTIIDDDDPPSLQFSESEYFAIEGDVTTPVSVTLSTVSAFSVTVQYEVIELSVGRQFIGNLTFNPGEISKVIDIPVDDYQVGDTLNIILSDPENATLSSPSSASLVIFDKNRSECHPLIMNFTGYGSEPLTTNLEKSLGCPVGQFVADELIFVSAQPDPGWVVNGWFGTLDDGLTSVENIVRMPDGEHVVSVFYITNVFLPSTSNKYITYFSGFNESEPNNTLSQANGPIQSNQEYSGDFSLDSDSYDNYYFHLDEIGDVQIQLVDIPVGRDYNLLLLNTDQELVGYSGSLDNDDEFISVRDLEPGLYYASVFYAEGPTSTAKYSLNVIYD